MVTLSLTAAMDSSVMYRALWTADSSFFSTRIGPIGRVISSSSEKMPTTFWQRTEVGVDRMQNLAGFALA